MISYGIWRLLHHSSLVNSTYPLARENLLRHYNRRLGNLSGQMSLNLFTIRYVVCLFILFISYILICFTNTLFIKHTYTQRVILDCKLWRSIYNIHQLCFSIFNVFADELFEHVHLFIQLFYQIDEVFISLVEFLVLIVQQLHLLTVLLILVSNLFEHWFFHLLVLFNARLILALNLLHF